MEQSKIIDTLEMYQGPAGHTSHSQDPDPAVKTGADTGIMPDCPPAKDSDDVSVTNSEVESAMIIGTAWLFYKTLAFQKRHLTPSARMMHTSELLEMGLTEPQSSI